MDPDVDVLGLVGVSHEKPRIDYRDFDVELC